MRVSTGLFRAVALARPLDDGPGAGCVYGLSSGGVIRLASMSQGVLHMGQIDCPEAPSGRFVFNDSATWAIIRSRGSDFNLHLSPAAEGGSALGWRALIDGQSLEGNARLPDPAIETRLSEVDAIAIEDLNVKGMARGMGRRAFRRGVSDAGLGEIRRQITYKANWHKRAVVAVDRFFPSSQLCSTPGCDYRNKGLKLSERQWTCPQCQTTHSRDINAATNIEREGLRRLAESTGPEGRTRRSRETDARGEYACAVTKSPVTGQPSSLNRELTYRAAKPPTTRQSRDGPAPRVEG